jgi:hypothetical protein
LSRIGSDEALDLAHLLAGVIEADALRRGNAHQRHRTVLGRGQFLRDGAGKEKAPPETMTAITMTTAARRAPCAGCAGR